jgi:hypothetical protein
MDDAEKLTQITRILMSDREATEILHAYFLETGDKLGALTGVSMSQAAALDAIQRVVLSD